MDSGLSNFFLTIIRHVSPSFHSFCNNLKVARPVIGIPNLHKGTILWKLSINGENSFPSCSITCRLKSQLCVALRDIGQPDLGL